MRSASTSPKLRKSLVYITFIQMVREVWIKVDKRIWRLERQALFESDNKYEDVNNDLYILGDFGWRRFNSLVTIGGE